MTSFRQIEANRRNALRSIGPKTEEGKQQSRRNALRHGLTAETVIEGLEDKEDYKAFEAAVIADYDARTAVERELVLRLASLLWRLRRIISIETDLLKIQSDIIRERRVRGPLVKPREESGSSTLSELLSFDAQQEDGWDGQDEASLCRASSISVRHDLLLSSPEQC
jgi:MoxR-like ATPase